MFNPFFWLWRRGFDKEMSRYHPAFQISKFTTLIDADKLEEFYREKTAPYDAYVWYWTLLLDRAASEIDPAMWFTFSDKLEPATSLHLFNKFPHDPEAAVLYAIRMNMTTMFDGKQDWSGNENPMYSLAALRYVGDNGISENAPREVQPTFRSVQGRLQKQAENAHSVRAHSVVNEQIMMGDKVLRKGLRVSVMPLRGDWGTIVGVSEGYQGQPYYEITLDKAKPDEPTVFCYARQLQWKKEDEDAATGT